MPEFIPPFYASRSDNGGTGNLTIGKPVPGYADLKAVVSLDDPENPADTVITYYIDWLKNKEWGSATVTTGGQLTGRTVAGTLSGGVLTTTDPVALDITAGAFIFWRNVEAEFDFATAISDSASNVAALEDLLDDASAAGTAIDGLQDTATTDAAAIAAARSDAEDDADAIAATKTNTDAQAAAIAAAVADINDAINPRLPVVNMLKDGGRFSDGSDHIYKSPVAGVFGYDAALLTPYNGASVAEAGKFISNNTTNGGSAGALETTVSDLLAAMGRAGEALRYGPEFYVAELTAGAGTSVTPVSGHYLMAALSQTAVLGLGGRVSFAVWARLTAGTAWVRNKADLAVDGVAIGGGNYEMSAAAGWVHLADTAESGLGYFTDYLPTLHGVDGTVIELALPILCPSAFIIPPHTQPLITT